MADNRIQFTFEINDKGKVKVDGLTKSFVSLDNAVNKVSADLKRQQTELGKANTGLKNTISDAGLAGATLTELGRTISDSNFGIRGMANNLSQLSTLFITLVSKRGGGISGVTLAFKQLGRQLLGPLGIILAFQSLIAFIENMAIKNDAAKKSIDEVTKAFSRQRKELNALAQTALSTVTEDYEKIEEEARLLAKSSKEFAAGFSKLNEGVLEGIPDITFLIYKFNELLEVRDEISDLTSKEKIDNEALREAIEKRIKLEEIFSEVRKKRVDFTEFKDIKGPIIDEDPSALDFFGVRADLRAKEDREFQKWLDNNMPEYIDDVDDAVDTYLLNKGKASLIQKTLGLTPDSRQKDLDALKAKYDGIIHLTDEYEAAIQAVNDKWNRIERDAKADHLQTMLGELGKFFLAAADLNEENKSLAKAAIIANGAAASVGIWASYFDPKAKEKGTFALAGVIAAQAGLIATTASALKSLNSNSPLGKNAESSAAGSQAPIFNVVGQSNVDQIGRSIATARQEPLRAYVVESDITNAQQLENARIQQASIG